MNGQRRRRAAVAMSGGVDSSTAAALLQEQGYEVVGLFMHLWDYSGAEPEGAGTCCAPRDVEDARAVARALDIPFYVVNFSGEFRREVVDYFAAEYARGRTPNPCIKCNSHIKFRPLLRRALELDAEFLATGHYARVLRDPRDGAYTLCRGMDHAKDQSYFLFTMTQPELAHIRFPLGEWRKDEVRRLAEERRLPVAEKRESQEICFIAGGDYGGFLEDYGAGVFPPGDVVDLYGRVIGRHRGIHRYTVGQRRGLGVAAPHPLYVAYVDRRGNRLVVGPRDQVGVTRFTVEHLSWVSGAPEPEGAEFLVRIRYRHRGRKARLAAQGDGACRLELLEGREMATPGQAAVFYRGDRVLGGGWLADLEPPPTLPPADA